MSTPSTSFCLLPQATEEFKKALKEGRLNPEILAGMTSAERHALLSDIVGKENATGVNSLFESKLLLKNQQQGAITWAKKVAGLKPEIRRDLISRIEKMDKVLAPAEYDQFLQDLAATKLGVNVTQEEAKTIADLSKKVQETKTTMENGGNRLEYGKAKVALGNYVTELKGEANKLSPLEYIKRPGKIVSDVAGTAKSIKASLDDSAIFRQGWKTLWTNPNIWQKNARQSFVDLVRQVGDKPVMDEITADIVSRPNYDRMVKAKLAVSTIEEAYPSQLPEKVPILGRIYKGSESAYTGFVYRTRADVFDKYLEVAKKTGVNIDDPKELRAIGKLVNSLTGRGSLGPLEPVANAVNNVFFSPRMMKSTIDTLTAHQLQKDVTPFVRKQAAKNLLKIVLGTAAVLAIARALKKDSVELDPKSSDFGKIKIGNTRFDVTGGMSGVVTLAARILTQSSKSSTTGIVKPLNSGFGSQTGMDVIESFFENKLSPAAALLKDLIKQKDFAGNAPTVMGELNNLFTPLPITTYQELKNDANSANDLLGLILDGLGIATNTYGQSTKDWSQNPSKELLQFKQKVGDQEFKKANDAYNTKVDDWTKANQGYIRDLPNDQKQVGITNAKQKIQDDIFKQYNFKYQASDEEKAATKAKAKATRDAKK